MKSNEYRFLSFKYPLANRQRELQATAVSLEHSLGTILAHQQELLV